MDSTAAAEEAAQSLDAKLGEEVLMVAAVTGRERESKMLADLSPTSQKRERKKNPRYSDYDLEENPEKNPEKTPPQKRRGRLPKKSSVHTDAPHLKLHCATQAAETSGEAHLRPDGQAPTKRRPGRPRKHQSISQQKEDGDGRAAEPVGEDDRETGSHIPLSKEPSLKSPVSTPKGSKKTPARRTPAKKAKTKELPGGAEAEQQPVETPRPKRKYCRKKVVEQETAPVLPVEQEETPALPDVETHRGGRPRRSAAKTALKYLHSLAQETLSDPEESASRSGSPDSLSDRAGRGRRAGAVRRKKRRKHLDSDDLEEDEDFIPGGGDEEMLEDEGEEEEEEEDLGSELGPATQNFNKSNRPRGVAANGMPNALMKPAWDAYVANRKFREEHCSTWVFPELVPSLNHWNRVPESELEKYLPQELQSAAFKVTREGLCNEETALQRLNRFQASAPHPERLDAVVFVGGPVWALEWCPVPDGATDSQYLAVACHQRMDQQHVFTRTSVEPGLLQLWDMGSMEPSSRPRAGRPSLAYGLALDRGFVWQLKWCPAGAWEPPSCSRKPPFLPRLGLLAVAVSSGVVVVYSLPQPAALASGCPPLPEAEGGGLPVYQAKEVLTLTLGASKAPHGDQSGQVLSMDWLPEKPHNIMALGFYDGTVGLWDLSSVSSLLRVGGPAPGVTLLPYRCFVAHEQAVRALCFCPASRNLLATGGADRALKLWDLKRLYEPLSVQRRNLTTELCWPLAAAGVYQAQEVSYASHGLHGAYYTDLGYLHPRSIFIAPRTTSVWSLCFSNWCNSLVTADTLGDVVLSLLPENHCPHPSLRRTAARRFPVFSTEMLRCTEEEERPQEEGPGRTAPPQHRGGGEGGVPEDQAANIQTYQQAAKTYYLHYSDSNLMSFKNYKKRAPWKRMTQSELKADLDLDLMPLAALHKVRFNPNMSAHTWVASGGQAGLLRVHCLQNMTSSQINQQVQTSQTQFSALYTPSEGGVTSDQ